MLKFSWSKNLSKLAHPSNFKLLLNSIQQCFMQYATLKKYPSNIWRRKNILSTNFTLKGESQAVDMFKILSWLHLFGTLWIEKWLLIQELYLCCISGDQYFWNGKRYYEIIRINKNSDGIKQTSALWYSMQIACTSVSVWKELKGCKSDKSLSGEI